LPSSRKTAGEQPGAKLISLEIARFLAAFAVALEHLSTTIPEFKLGPAPLPPMPASAAVLFFFTLSGFVIYTAHYQDAGQLTRLPRYIWRRAWRIFPLYWLSLVPMLIVLWNGCSAAYLVKIFTLAPFTGPIAELNPPAWTLRAELLFYIIFGLALLPYARRVLLPVWFLLLAAAWYHDLRGWGGPTTLLPWLPPGVSAHLFALNNIMFFGGLGAGWAFARWQPRAALLWPLLGASLLALALLLRLDAWGTFYPADSRLPFTAAAFATVIFALGALERGKALRLSHRWAALGAISYPLYLMHSGAGFIIGAHLFFHPADSVHFHPLPIFFLMLFMALAASTLAALLFDAPLQRLARRVM
jgi:exopolysaccharide production protein ExoZ